MPGPTSCRYSALRILSFVAATAGLLCCGITGAFTVFANDVKDAFNLTQSEVSVLSSAGLFGRYIGFPASLMYEAFGPKPTSFVALVSSSLGFGLMFMASQERAFFIHFSWLFSVFYFIGCNGCVFSYFSSLLTNMHNTSKSKVGLVVALSDSVTYASAILFSAIHYFVTLTNKEDVLGTTFLAFSGLVFCANTLGVVFLKQMSVENGYENPDPQCASINKNSTTKDENYETFKLKESVNSYDYVPLNNSNYSVLSKFRNVMTNCHVQMLVCMAVLALSVNIMFVENSTTILRSAHLSEYYTLVTITLPLVGLVVNCIICYLSDKLVHKVNRSVFTLVLNVIHLTAQLCLLFKAMSFTWIIVVVVLEAISGPAMFSLCATIMSEQHVVVTHGFFGTLWSVVLLLNAFGGLGCNALFGAIYDSRIDSQNAYTNACFGQQCFTVTFIVSSGLCLLATIVNGSVILKEYIERRNMEEVSDVTS